MTVVLDSGGVSALAGNRARLGEMRRRGQWPPELPSIVLTEALTGDHRRDFDTNSLLRLCLVRPVTDDLARQAAQLRTQTGRAGSISAVDAVVAALATRSAGSIVMTSDPRDITSLVNQNPSDVRVVGV